MCTNLNDKISIIVPIYNVEKYLRQCLDSIVCQTYGNLEIILVDDGSSDSCGAVCDEYVKKDSRIMVVHQENQGVSVARNVGIEMATGSWIMFVDPDDWLELDCCEKVIECTREKLWDVVYFQYVINDERGEKIKENISMDSFVLTDVMIKKIQLEGLADRMRSLVFMVPWGKIYRKALLDQYGCKFPIGIKKRQDCIFNLYCLEYIKQAYYFDFVGYHYRINSNSICRRENKEMLDILLALLKEAEKFVRKYHQHDEKYARALGIFTIAIHGDLKKTLFFYSGKRMFFHEYQKYMNQYYNDEVVKRYIGKCSLNDFKGIRGKTNYLLLVGHHVFLYYIVSSIYLSIGQ